MKYTFSTREKIMIGALIIIAIGFAWYQFLYTPIQNRIADLDAQVVETQDEIVLREALAATVASQQDAIDKWEEEGVKPVFLPDFDNTMQLMAFLKGILPQDNYSMSFDNPVKSEDGTVHRLGTITFTVGSYAAAREVVQNIARGPYPCTISALGISDRSAGSPTKTGDVSVNMQLTFFERITAGTDLEEEDKTPEVQGNDWSEVINSSKAPSKS